MYDRIPYPKFVSPFQWLIGPQDFYGQESPYGENPVTLAPFTGDANMQGVSSDNAEHLGPWQASGDHSMLSKCAELPSPKSQGKDVGNKNINEILSVTPGERCSCLLCLPRPTWLETANESGDDWSPAYAYCRVLGCDWEYSDAPTVYSAAWRHEKSHFYDTTRNEAGVKKLICKQEYCKYSTKRYSDIKRHYAAKHCKNAKKFPCHIIGCKFSGDNGFPRKDKLRDHLKASHRDMFAPGKPVQTIKPKVEISKAGGNV
ncbi:hypothetical protein N7G274_010502 [Stereocaulon virgatum]|uniref:C2H2-type domain-containing protein n=1 Tax=Stereocaulon virgatum TaxID=373712 RepID=A0ABR3ZU74_9LECA